MIESVYRVREVAFNANLLRQRVVEELAREQVEARLGTEVVGLHRTSDGTVDVLCNSPGGSLVLTGSAVYNCTYARLNRILELAGAPAMPLKHEVTEIALVETPPVLSDIAITVMCGPFFSLMPFPALGLHSLSHVRYTPHGSWTDGAGSRLARRLLGARRLPEAIAFRAHGARRAAIRAGAPGRASRGLALGDQDRPTPERGGRWPADPAQTRPRLARVDLCDGSKIDNVYDMLDLLRSEPRLA